MSSINSKLSQAYGIVPFGEVGMQIIRDGRSCGKFNKKPSQFENWQEALTEARKLGPIQKQAPPALPEISYPMIPGEGAPQYTFDLQAGDQLSLF